MLRAVLESAPDFIGLCDLNGVILFLNRAAPGLSVEEAIGKTVFDYTPAEYRDTVREGLDRVVETGELTQYESVGAGPYGEFSFYETRLAPIIEDDAVVAITFIASDVTLRRKLEDQLRTVQKMDAVSKLAAGVAHNFNNMLMGILPNIQLAERKANPEALPYLREAREATIRVGELVRQLTLFATPRAVGALRDDDLGAIVRRTVALCAKMFPGNIAIEVNIQEPLPVVSVDAGQLEQALINVCLNARDALIDAAEPKPHMKVEVIAVPYAAVPAGVRPREHRDVYARVRITDNGIGMSERVKERMFEPFFTTKEVGKGTGLGLATTYAIVREHDGVVNCRSSPNEGTELELYLPTFEREEVAVQPLPSAARTAGRKRVLVIDDEALVRRAVTRVLEAAGFDVVSAPDGPSGLVELQRAGAHVDVVVVDQSMPGMRGDETVSEVRRIDPSMPVVFLTGAAGVPNIDPSCAVLHKPVMPRELVVAVARATSRR
jgi:PAS domain S-box-containing protein